MGNYSGELHDRIVEITRDYLGPASQRFIDRQITNHLNKQPEQIDYKDLPPLIEWIEIATSLITEDRSIVKEYTQRLETLTRRQKAG